MGIQQCSQRDMHNAVWMNLMVHPSVTAEANATVKRAVNHLQHEHDHQVSIGAILGGLPMLVEGKIGTQIMPRLSLRLSREP